MQSIVSLWENQLLDFYLLENCIDYNEIKTRLKGYYDLDLDSTIDEIRQVNNYLKHGANGNAEKKLIKMNSRFYRNDGYNGEARGNYYRSKQLNLSLTDIEVFANAFIIFWTEIYERIEQIEKTEKIKTLCSYTILFLGNLYTFRSLQPYRNSNLS
ncbi:MAG: hypothetical protein K2L52_01440 [Clostridia bacterium]|nr:hypothetical protein [Clostridia bacterium]